MKALFAAVGLALLLPPVSALAANEPHPTLDAIALEVAGVPVSVWCETDATAWGKLAAGAGLSANLRGFVRWTPGGPIPVGYIGPGACVTLRGRLLHPDWPIAPSRVGPSLLTLLHESVHLHGVRDEAVTDCAALGLVKTYAIRYFGYRETVERIRRVTRWEWVIRDGERIWAKVQHRVRVTVPNPAVDALYAAAFRDHRLKPPPYQGKC